MLVTRSQQRILVSWKRILRQDMLNKWVHNSNHPQTRVFIKIWINTISTSRHQVSSTITIITILTLTKIISTSTTTIVIQPPNNPLNSTNHYFTTPHHYRQRTICYKNNLKIMYHRFQTVAWPKAQTLKNNIFTTLQAV